MTGRYGSLCSGYEGLGLALQAVVDVEPAWFADIDPAASAILTHHYPGVPNHGDITTCDWTGVEPVDWLTAGHPCQPFSHAGKRKGADDERHLWPYVERAIGVLRPRRVLLENVAGHVSLGLDQVLWDLAALGFDAEWVTVRASDTGAPHARARVFILAADAEVERHERLRPARRRGPGPADSRDAATDTPGDGRGEGRAEPARLVGRPDAAEHGHASAAGAGQGGRGAAVGHLPKGQPDLERDAGAPAPDADRDERARQHAQQPWRVAAAGHRGDCVPGCTAGWTWVDDEGRDYGPAIRRWHDLTRCVPRPTAPTRTGAERLNPEFDEWLMGLPHGWVTGVPGLSRNAQLKACGLGVVPQQAAYALSILLPRLADREPAA